MSMEMKDLNENDELLIQKARDVINMNFDYKKNNHTVGAALRCKNGNIYVGVNVHFNHGTCAEVIAIGSAITVGEREFDCIVAVDGEGDILSPCGNCRQMLSEYALNCDVIMTIDGKNMKIKVLELIPFAYVRKTSWSKLKTYSLLTKHIRDNAE